MSSASDIVRIQMLLASSRYQEAEKAVRAELTKSMDDDVLFVLLARSLRFQNKLQKANDAAARAIELDPENDDAHFELAAILTDRNDHKKALVAIEESLRLEPEASESFAVKAQILGAMGKQEQALEAADQGLRLDPECESCRFYRGILLSSLNRGDEAELESLGLLAEDPDSAENHCSRGYVLINTGDAVGAEQHFVQALRINPESDDAKFGLAHAIKMRNPLVGGTLRLLRWIDKCPFWIYLIGAFVLVRIANMMRLTGLPLIGWLGVGILIAFIALMLVFVANQLLFDYVLLASTRGRYALSDRRRSALKWCMVPLVIGIGLFAYWAIDFAIRNHMTLPSLSVTWICLAVILYETLGCESRWIRTRMAGIVAAAVAITIGVNCGHYFYLGPKVEAANSKLSAATLGSVKEVMDLALSKQDQNESPTTEESNANASINESDNNESKVSPEVEKGLAGFESELQKNSDEHRAKLKEINRLGKFMVSYPALLLLLIACYVQEIRDWLTRYAPDED